MKRRINIAASLMHDPQLIIMDEPTVGIDPQSRNKIYEMLEDLHNRNKQFYIPHIIWKKQKKCAIV